MGLPAIVADASAPGLWAETRPGKACERNKEFLKCSHQPILYRLQTLGCLRLLPETGPPDWDGPQFRRSCTSVKKATDPRWANFAIEQPMTEAD